MLLETPWSKGSHGTPNMITNSFFENFPPTYFDLYYILQNDINIIFAKYSFLN